MADDTTHLVYVRLSYGEVHGVREPFDGVNVDLDAMNQVLGFEFLSALSVEIDGLPTVPMRSKGSRDDHHDPRPRVG